MSGFRLARESNASSLSLTLSLRDRCSVSRVLEEKCKSPFFKFHHWDNFWPIVSALCAMWSIYGVSPAKLERQELGWWRYFLTLLCRRLW